MTNGEKFKEVFKTSDVDEGLLYAFVWLSKPDEVAEINIEWWNEEYKEPTTKNDLVVDCNNCKNNFHRGDGTSYCATGDGMCHFEREETFKNDLGVDCISRKAVQTRLKEIINEMETIFADIREREVNDSVCGLCEYDCDHGLDGYANECPGFEKDDCFKLNEKYKAEWLDISNIPSVTPQEPILDKIRAEIEQLHLIGYAIVDGKREIASRAVMQIIDKYKKESEG